MRGRARAGWVRLSWVGLWVGVATPWVGVSALSGCADTAPVGGRGAVDEGSEPEPGEPEPGEPELGEPEPGEPEAGEPEGEEGQGAEACDAIDNDGDGEVDEGIACLCGADSGCYGGPPEARGVGACSDGARECANGEFWGPCSGWVEPSAEVCGDGVDSDCDGVLDNGCCEAEERCGDGVDNDCNGQIDEDCAACDPDEACGDGVDNDCDGAIDEGCDLCGDVEICGDGLDNDCDGAIDEDCDEECGPGLNRACFPGNPGQINVGACRAGMQRCVDETLRWGQCAGAVLPVEEVCDDGVDNDCDGRADEGCVQCGEAEVCFNGVDDDCNGQVDEGCGAECAPGEVEACFPGPGNPGVGLCRAGERACDARGFWGPCRGAVTAQADACENGVDEDCDGRDLECGPVQVPLFLVGDCVTARCPSGTPHPVGCNVFFTPGDDRGCVANRPNDPEVYFQAGDDCDRGLVTGFLLCAEAPGRGLSAGNCPVNKPQVFYPETREGCPATD